MLNHLNSRLQYVALFVFVLCQLSLNTRIVDGFSGWAITRNQAENLNTLSQYINGFGIGILAWIFIVPMIIKYKDNTSWLKNYKQYIKTWILVPLMFVVSFYMYSSIHCALLTFLTNQSSPEQKRLSLLTQAQVRVDDKKIGFIKKDMHEASYFMSMVFGPYFYMKSMSVKDIADGSLSSDAAAYSLMPNIKETCEKVVPLINAISKYYTDAYYPYSANMIGDISLTPKGQRDEIYHEMMVKYGEDFKSSTGMKKIVPPGLTWNQFIHHPSLEEHFQDRLKEKGAPEYIYKGFKPSMTCLEFQDKVFIQEHNKVRDHIARTMYLDAVDFEEGGQYYKYGVNAIRKTYIPMVILFTASIITMPIFVCLIYFPLVRFFSAKINYGFYVENKKLVDISSLGFLIIFLILIPLTQGVDANRKVKSSVGILSRWQIGVEPIFYRGFGLFGKEGRFSCMSDHVFDYNREMALREETKQSAQVKPVTDRWSNCWH